MEEDSFLSFSLYVFQAIRGFYQGGSDFSAKSEVMAFGRCENIES